jgi:hypothetical protein
MGSQPKSDIKQRIVNEHNNASFRFKTDTSKYLIATVLIAYYCLTKIPSVVALDLHLRGRNAYFDRNSSIVWETSAKSLSVQVSAIATVITTFKADTKQKE